MMIFLNCFRNRTLFAYS